MQVPIQISYHHVDKSEAVDTLIHEKARHLEKFCDHITSCRVVVERPHRHEKSGHPYRVRLDITIPPGHELAVEEGPSNHDMHEPLHKVVNDAFKTAERRVKELVERQRGL